jgi:hypothetical protein
MTIPLKLLLAFAILAVSAFAQSGVPAGAPTIVPIPNYVPGTAQAVPIPNYEGGAVLVPVTEGAPQVIPDPVLVTPAPVPLPPVKLTRRARFNNNVKTIGIVTLVVVVLAARVYVAGHAF